LGKTAKKYSHKRNYGMGLSKPVSQEATVLPKYTDGERELSLPAWRRVAKEMGYVVNADYVKNKFEIFDALNCKVVIALVRADTVTVD